MASAPPIAAPYRCGATLDAGAFASVRRTLLIRHCKWDPQVGDAATLAPFPLSMSQATWQELATTAEQLTREAEDAAREIQREPKLLSRLGLPRQLRRALAQLPTSNEREPPPRTFRYDFHFTRDGWRISECNADVPGGYAEASAFPELMAHHYPSLKPAGDPGGACARVLLTTAQGAPVALLSAPGFMEDHQVVRYLAQRLTQLGGKAHCAQPTQIEWRAGNAHHRGKRLGALFRFYQAEWLAQLPRELEWRSYFSPAETPVLNPGSCIILESKRFPLVWDALSSRLGTWRRLLPRTVDPREAPWERDDSWLLKTALCNTGDTVSARALLAPPRWAKVARAARWFPNNWVAQERFEPVPLETPIGPVFPCIGIYTIAGRAAGAYVRLSRGPIVDFAAIDAALLLEEPKHVADA